MLVRSGAEHGLLLEPDIALKLPQSCCPESRYIHPSWNGLSMDTYRKQDPFVQAVSIGQEALEAVDPPAA